MVPARTAPQFMYHCFPRRRGEAAGPGKGLDILELILEFGFLLTPEVEVWHDRKVPPSPPEEYQVVSKRCCFTELPEGEVFRHAAYFGQFALEFETRVLCDLGALPVFYVPRTTSSDGYGPGAAIVTQLAHVQEVLERLTAFRDFANVTGGPHPEAPLLATGSNDGGLTIGIPGGETLTVSGEVVARAAELNPAFKFEPPQGVVPLGLSAGTLLSLMNMLHWGIHQPQILTGTLKALGSLLYSTERQDDPFLSHYQQREWRLIGNIKKDGVEVCQPVPTALRERLMVLDPGFFERRLELRGGPVALVDTSRVYSVTPEGRSVRSFIRRVIAPAEAVVPARKIVWSAGVKVDVVALEELPGVAEAM